MREKQSADPRLQDSDAGIQRDARESAGSEASQAPRFVEFSSNLFPSFATTTTTTTMSRDRPLVDMGPLPSLPPPSYAAAHDDEEEKDAPPRRWYHYFPTSSTSAKAFRPVPEF